MGTKRNKYLVRPSEGEVELILLEKDLRTIKASVFFDIEDLEKVQAKSWSITDGRLRYVRCAHGTYLHRLLIDAPPDLHVDHRDGDGFNNRRSNLRLVTLFQNLQNVTKPARNKKSGLPLGVIPSGSPNKPYLAQFTVFGKRYKKNFKTPEEASQWYWETKQRLLDEHDDGITLGVNPHQD